MEESICFRTFWIVSTDTLDALSWNKKVIKGYSVSRLR
jgi:hypothetical protein